MLLIKQSEICEFVVDVCEPEESEAVIDRDEDDRCAVFNRFCNQLCGIFYMPLAAPVRGKWMGRFTIHPRLRSATGSYQATTVQPHQDRHVVPRLYAGRDRDVKVQALEFILGLHPARGLLGGDSEKGIQVVVYLRTSGAVSFLVSMYVVAAM